MSGGPTRRAETLGYGNKGRLRGLTPKLYVAPRDNVQLAGSVEML